MQSNYYNGLGVGKLYLLPIVILLLLLTTSLLQAQNTVDLAIVAVSNTATVNNGQTFTISLALTNQSNTDATGVQVSAPLSSALDLLNANASAGSYDATTGVWDIGILTANNTVTLDFSLEATPDAIGPVNVDVEVISASPDDIDSTPNNNDTTEDDFSTACVSIITPFPCDGTRFRASAPDGFESYQWYVLDDATGDFVPIPAEEGGTSQALLITGPGAYNFTVNGDAILGECGAQSCCPFITAEPDCVFADLELSKNAFFEFASDPTLEYQLIVTNNGPDPTTNIQVEDFLPPGLSFLGKTQTNYNEATNIWTINELGVGETTTVSVFFVITDFTVDEITNTAEIIASDTDDNDSTPNNGDPDEDDFASATVSLADLGLQAPVITAVNDEVTTEVNIPITVNPVQNDSTTGGAALTLSAIGSAANGIAVFQGGQLLYTPDPNFVGIDSVEYQVCAGNSFNCTTATVFITVEDYGCTTDILFVGEQVNSSRDQVIIDRLEAQGYNVNFVASSSASINDIDGMDLLFISATTLAGSVRNTFRNVAIPAIVSEPALFDNMRMTVNGSNFLGTDRNNTQLDIINQAHPLAAGLTGVTMMTTANRRYSWGRPAGDPILVATLPDDPNRYPIFAFEKGAQMQNLIAPARRVGFFLHNRTPDSLTPEGFLLLDAAVVWALDGCQDDCSAQAFCAAPAIPLEVCPTFCELQEPYNLTNISSTNNATITTDNGGCLTYIALPLFTGEEILDIEACDIDGVCETKRVFITVSTNGCDPNGKHKESIEETIAYHDLDIYPNPTTDHITLAFEAEIEDEEAQIRIFSLAGTMLLEYANIDVLQGNNKHDLSLQELPAGMYFVQLFTEGNIYRKKVIKQ